ncbi:dimethylaniline monooxygenase [N-oxide-forming] 2-like, partial [Centruroides sculpturatus]|uniref:dimethylaniline monooxygenase [N-oxide-forming] 2-like n=1 Tax=Centruroides sculpturatus TaxID=218467 RepID=UPI000C6D4175
MELKKRIAVIGAGASGIVSIKICKEETLQVLCYEMTDKIGGLWNYREENIEGIGSVCLSTVMNSSKELSAFSDFPPSEAYPNYMPHSLVTEYYQMYAKKNSLFSNILFNRKVISICPSHDYEVSGKWKVIAINYKTMKEEEDIFDAVLICTGHHCYPKIISFPCQEIFNGKIIHSHEYKTPLPFKNKRVLVVGSGNSALDIAVDLCGTAKVVCLSSRSGTWVMPRVGPKGLPFDSIFRSRIFFLIREYLPEFIVNTFLEYIVNYYFNHKLYGLKPNFGFINGHPSTNDLLSFYIINGSITIKKDIKTLTKSGVIFMEDDAIVPIDDIILATGYNANYFFIENDIVDFSKGLYKEIVPPDLKHNTLGFIGFVQLLGSFVPIAEIQARWFVQVLKGNITLPSKMKMQEWIRNAKSKRISQFGNNDRYSLEIRETYIDELAAEIGAKPFWLKMILFDPKLFYHCLMGPFLPYQYRLEGPHRWPGAREAILKFKQKLF